MIVLRASQMIVEGLDGAARVTWGVNLSYPAGPPDTLEVAPAAAFKGNKAKAVWLPDETTAKAWQDYLRH